MPRRRRHPTGDSSRDRSSPLPIDLGSKAPEAQRVIAVGANVAPILKPSRPREAAAADVTMWSEQATECGSGHVPSVTIGPDRSGHTHSFRRASRADLLQIKKG